MRSLGTVMLNLLLTAPPRSGTTRVIWRLHECFAAHGHRVGGIYSPEIRADGDRVGFEIVDVMTGEGRVMAHVDRADGPQVGTYRVHVANVDAVCTAAFPAAFAEADVLVIDEIAPMEVYSDAFVHHVRRALGAAVPVVAAIHARSTAGFIGEVKDRPDTERCDVTPDNRDDLPATVGDRICNQLYVGTGSIVGQCSFVWGR